MSRVYAGDDWFEPIGDAALYEAEFEKIILTRTAAVFPGFEAVKFKACVYSDTASAIPDFALVEHEYREWWVVEVELAAHSLDSHVLPQVSTLVHAKYGAAEAEYLAGRNPSLDRARLSQMVRGLAPRVLVVVNRLREEWRDPLAALPAGLCHFQVLRSSRGRYAFCVDGDCPSYSSDVLSQCFPEPELPWMLRVTSPAGLPACRSEPLQLELDGVYTQWDRLDTADAVWLVPKTGARLPARGVYDLLRLENGAMSLRPTRTDRLLPGGVQWR